jgi:hypothetical protein
VTFDTSQLPISPLNFVVSLNIEFMFVALEVFHCDISPSNKLYIKTSSTSSIDSINSQLTVASADTASTNIARKQVFSNVQISKTQDDFNEISLSTKIRSEDVLISIYDYETSYLLSPSLFKYIKTESESGLLKIIIKPNTEFGKDIKRLKVVTIG